MTVKKGMSMPIEIIVIVAVVVLVLVVVVAFFVTQSGNNINSINTDSAWGQGCTILSMQRNCQIDPSVTGSDESKKQQAMQKIEIPGYVDQNGRRKTLWDACQAKGYGAADCWKFCGCQ